MRLSALMGEGFKYIARDQGGDLYAFLEKPEKLKKVWASFGIHRLVDSTELDFIKWEDDQPYEITEVIGGKSRELA